MLKIGALQVTSQIQISSIEEALEVDKGTPLWATLEVLFPHHY